MATNATHCAVDRLVVVERPRQVAGLVGRVTVDRRGIKRGQGKGQVLIAYSARLPGHIGVEGKLDGWYFPSTLSDASAHEDAYKAAQKSGKVYKLGVEGEESNEASSDDEAPAPLAVGDRVLMGGRSVVIAALPPPGGVWWKVRVDGEEADRNVRRSQFLRMGEQPAPAPPPPPPPQRSSRREGGGQLFTALMRRSAEPSLEVETDEIGSIYRLNPVGDKVRHLSTIVLRIRKGEKAGGNDAPGTREHAAAVFHVAAPGMPAYFDRVLQRIGTDATDGDLAEFVVTYLEEKCLKLDGSGYLEQDELADLQHVIRDAVAEPDSEAQRRTWHRIADNLCRYLHRRILNLDEGSLAEATWIRDRARVAVETRSEQAAINGALSDWTIGQAASMAERRRNMWTEKLKGAERNCDPPHRDAWWGENRFAVSASVPYLREAVPGET